MTRRAHNSNHPKPLRAALTTTVGIIMVIAATVGTSCVREPDLHLYATGQIELQFLLPDLELDRYWNYDDVAGYRWRDEWYYGWDDDDRELSGEVEYTYPSVFKLRRYYTGEVAMGPHLSMVPHTVEGYSHRTGYTWGFWDALVWNEVFTPDGIQSIVIDEAADYSEVTASTNQSLHPSRYQAPQYVRAFYEPEALFSAYRQAIDVDRDQAGGAWDLGWRDRYTVIPMQLQPLTYIYLTQVILYNNHGRVTGIDGRCDLSGMARSTSVNSGIAGSDPITIYYNARMKKNLSKGGRQADIIGGKLMSFGLCGHNGHTTPGRSAVADEVHHYMDVTMMFSNGMDSTLVFDVTKQVRNHYRGGVITVELDIDTVPLPRRSGGSGFDAVVEEFQDGGTHEIEM